MASLQTSQESADVARCSICTKLYENPKMLPCLHTFCLKCIEKYADGKNSGEAENCPFCKKEFSIPPEGIEKLPTNVFVVKLVDTRKISSCPKLMCDLCVEDGKIDDGKIAKLCCLTCDERYCENCAICHTKAKVTRSHKVVDITDKQTEQIRPSFCDKHGYPIEYHCNDCEDIFCMKCYLKEHNMHNTEPIEIIADKLRQQLQIDAEQINDIVEKCKLASQNCEKEKGTLLDGIDAMDMAISGRSKDLHQLVNEHTQNQLHQLNHMKKKFTCQFGINKEQINGELAVLESFVGYCQEVIGRATPADIYRMADDLHARGIELQNIELTNALSSPQIEFFPLDIEDVLTEDKLNIVGVIHQSQCQTGLQFTTTIHYCQKFKFLGLLLHMYFLFLNSC